MNDHFDNRRQGTRGHGPTRPGPSPTGRLDLAREKAHHALRRMERDAPGAVAALRTGKVYTVASGEFLAGVVRVEGHPPVFRASSDAETCRRSIMRVRAHAVEVGDADALFVAESIPVTMVRVEHLRAFLDAHGAGDVGLILVDDDANGFPVDQFVQTAVTWDVAETRSAR